MTSERKGLGWRIVLGPAEVVTLGLLTMQRSSETRERLKSAALRLKKRVERGSGAMQRAVGKT